jgi:hypothetical protein
MKHHKAKGGDLYQGDCLKVMKQLYRQGTRVDLVIGSPPYEDVRTYGINFDLKGQDWVDWMVKVFKASLKICDGIVAMVVGHGKGGRNWSGVPALLMADLIRAGVVLRSPCWYHKHGLPGGGGKDWFRSDVEFIVCAANHDDQLDWSDNTACGHPPKYGAGGNHSHRTTAGRRVNGTRETRVYKPPKLANPGNVIDCGAVGGGHLGSKISHETDAPYPEKIPNFFIRSLCPPEGTVLDPFCGSGTTPASAIKLGRRFIGIDIRASQIKLCQRRIKEATYNRGFEELF